eukprot:jgi/Botrbrau1/573/Bobra.0010s0039.1
MMIMIGIQNFGCSLCFANRVATGWASMCPPQGFRRHPPPLIRKQLICMAMDEGNARASIPEEAISAQRPDEGVRRPQPLPVKGMKLEKVEKLGDEAWAGVAAVDRGDDSTALGRIALLVGGDVAVLLLFVAIGRANHGQPLDPPGVVSATLPFLIGWLAAGALVGGYGKDARGGSLGPAVLAALKTWALGIPLAVAIRSAQKGYIPDKSFILVGLGVTFVMMLTWRAGLAAVTPKETSATEEMKRRKDKRGNPLEFFQLLTSLTKRW